MIKYGVAKQILSKYEGSGGSCNPAKIDLFVRKVLQYLLYQGTHGNERAFTFQAERGHVTLPRELETPLKLKINGEVANVWNRWFEYHSGVGMDGALDAYKSLVEDPNRYPIVFDLPPGEHYVCTRGTAIENDDAHIIVKGVDGTGREIFTYHQGEKIVGEYLSIVKGLTVQSNVKFAKITGIDKTITEGYTQLLWKSESGKRGFLAEYDPFEESPSYKRITLTSPCSPICSVTILGRIKLRDYYADEDVIPFDNLHLLELAGQTLNNSYNDDLNSVIAQEGRVEKLIEKESNYKRVTTGQPIEFLRAKSGGIIKNVKNIRRGRY